VRSSSTFVACGLASALVAGCASRRLAEPSKAKPAALPQRPPGRTVADVLATLGPAAERRLRPRFAEAGVRYPPSRVHLLGFKQERRLELWASSGRGPRQIAVYPLTDESGGPGPKMREGDFQIPEGIYRVSWLHPNSDYHLSMKLDYPNAFDREQAQRDGRTNLGGDIFIHGKDVSIGCLAVGDRAIEELFVLAARVGIENVTTVVAPWDLRRRPPPDLEARIPWAPALYARLSRTLAAFR